MTGNGHSRDDRPFELDFDCRPGTVVLVPWRWQFTVRLAATVFGPNLKSSNLNNEQNSIATVFRKSTGVWIPVLVFFAALIVRILYLLESRDNPTFLVPIVDMERHHLAATTAISDASVDPIFQAGRPYFYPLFLSSIYRLFDSSVVHAKVLQSILGSLTCLMTFVLGTRVFGRSVGILAGLIAAFYGPMIFWEAELVASGLGAFWTVILLLLLVRKVDEQGYGILFLVGFVGALATITRPAFLLFVLAASSWVLLIQARFHGSVMPVVRRAAVLLAGFLLVTLPVLFLSHQATGRATLIPPSGGFNAYVGNNEDACRTLNVRPGPDFDELINWPVSQGHETNAEQSRFFYGKVGEFVSEEPLLFLEGLARKAGQYLNGTEAPRTVDIYVFHEWSSLLRMLVWKVAAFGFPWGVLLPLAAVALMFRWRQIPIPIVLLITLYPVLLIAIFIAGRYRIPVVPVMSILAAAGCFSIVEMFRQKKWIHASASCCLTVLIGSAVAAEDFSCPDQPNYEVELYSIVGHHYLKSDDLGASSEYLEEALRLDPNSGVANRLYGLLLIRREQFDEAITHCNKALEFDSRDHVALYRRGLAHSGNLDFEQAKVDLAEALAIAPYYSQANLKLGEIQYRLGEYGAARRNWKEAVSKGGPVAVQASKYLQTMPR